MNVNTIYANIPFNVHFAGKLLMFLDLDMWLGVRKLSSIAIDVLKLLLNNTAMLPLVQTEDVRDVTSYFATIEH